MQGGWSNVDSDWQLKRLQHDSVKTADRVVQTVRAVLQEEIVHHGQEYEKMFGKSSAQYSEFLNMIIEKLEQSGVAPQVVMEWLNQTANDGAVPDDHLTVSRHAQSETIPHIRNIVPLDEQLTTVAYDDDSEFTGSAVLTANGNGNGFGNSQYGSASSSDVQPALPLATASTTSQAALPFSAFPAAPPSPLPVPASFPAAPATLNAFSQSVAQAFPKPAHPGPLTSSAADAWGAVDSPTGASSAWNAQPANAIADVWSSAPAAPKAPDITPAPAPTPAPVLPESPVSAPVVAPVSAPVAMPAENPTIAPLASASIAAIEPVVGNVVAAWATPAANVPDPWGTPTPSNVPDPWGTPTPAAQPSEVPPISAPVASFASAPSNVPDPWGTPRPANVPDAWGAKSGDIDTSSDEFNYGTSSMNTAAAVIASSWGAPQTANASPSPLAMLATPVNSQTLAMFNANQNAAAAQPAGNPASQPPAKADTQEEINVWHQAAAPLQVPVPPAPQAWGQPVAQAPTPTEYHSSTFSTSDPTQTLPVQTAAAMPPAAPPQPQMPVTPSLPPSQSWTAAPAPQAIQMPAPQMPAPQFAAPQIAAPQMPAPQLAAPIVPQPLPQPVQPVQPIQPIQPIQAPAQYQAQPSAGWAAPSPAVTTAALGDMPDSPWAAPSIPIPSPTLSAGITPSVITAGPAATAFGSQQYQAQPAPVTPVALPPNFNTNISGGWAQPQQVPAQQFGQPVNATAPQQNYQQPSQAPQMPAQQPQPQQPQAQHYANIPNNGNGNGTARGALPSGQYFNPAESVDREEAERYDPATAWD